MDFQISRLRRNHTFCATTIGGTASTKVAAMRQSSVKMTASVASKRTPESAGFNSAVCKRPVV